MIKKSKVVIVGAGKGGSAIIEMLNKDPVVKITGVVDIRKDAAGIKLAKKYRIPVGSDLRKFISRRKDINLIINVTGRDDVTSEIYKIKPSGTEVMGGFSAKFMWDLIDERARVIEDTNRQVKEYEAFYRLGLTLTSGRNIKNIHNVILEYATRLTNTPAGSIAIFDERHGKMSLVASRGFSSNFMKGYKWKLRKKGLTDFILNSSEPVIINNIKRYPEFSNPYLLAEGIKAVAASSLSSEGKIIGILYVDDFVPRRFTQREVSLFSLVSTYAAIAIDRTRLVDDTIRISITDGLTQLYNYRYFMNRFTEELKRVRRYDYPFGVMMIDIDHFKNYNDMHGHLAGNEILKRIATILKAESREVDIVARYGGEEFVILLPEVGDDTYIRIAERLRKKIEKKPFPLEETQPLGKITVSIGCAVFPKDGTTVDDLLKKADDALYRAKHEGRNRVICS